VHAAAVAREVLQERPEAPLDLEPRAVARQPFGQRAVVRLDVYLRECPK